jgi:hypothetical protein
VTVGYPESPLNGPDIAGDEYKGGQRFRRALNGTPAGAGCAPRFELFSASDDVAKELPPELAKLVNIRIDSNLGDNIYLVRPDGYLACSTRVSRDLEAYLSKLI